MPPFEPDPAAVAPTPHHRQPAAKPQRRIHVGRFLVRSASIIVLLSLLMFLLFRTVPEPRHGADALEEDQFLIGAWLGTWPTPQNAAIDYFEEDTGTSLDMVDLFVDWQTPWSNVSDTLRHITQEGAVPVVSWEPHGYTTNDIVDGTHKISLRDKRVVTLDEYIAEFSAGLCDHYTLTGVPVIVRPMHEMNGQWYSWGTAYEEDGRKPNPPDMYRKAWIKLQNPAETECPEGVRWMWAVNHFSTGGTTWMQTYPGAKYVDFVGIDGYNWGSHAEWGWQSFDTLFKAPYCAVTNATEHPVIIAEIGSTEAGGDKAAWIRDAFERVHSGSFGRVRGMTWFNDAKWEVEVHGPMDWPVDSSVSSAAAFAESADLLRSQKLAVGQESSADVCGS